MNNSTELIEHLITTTTWFLKKILTYSSLLQLFTVVVIAIISQVFSEKIKNQLAGFHERHPVLGTPKPKFFKEGSFLVAFFILLWSAFIVTKENGWPHDILEVCANLTTAWCVIRIFSYPFEESFYLKFIIASIWIITALNILGLFHEVVDLLGKISIKIGLYEIGLYELSVLTVLKATIYFIAVLWLIKIITTVAKNRLKKNQTLSLAQKVLFNKLIKIGLFVFALLVSLQLLGLDLRSLAFFSGALGIVVAFSLQKVFSNFISGLILLMDKSIKPGDVIAIGNTYGWVKRLNSRYVSLITRDGKEHLIPNETLISERVENWSYSDNNLRLHIPVGISYNSDLKKAREIILHSVKENDRILSSPTPTCQIIGLGENGFNLELRVWIQDPVNGIGNITHDILAAIWEQFKRHKIKIASPQVSVYMAPSEEFTQDFVETFKEINEKAPRKTKK
jgi:small-conductance mechanosensitive channel